MQPRYRGDNCRDWATPWILDEARGKRVDRMGRGGYVQGCPGRASRGAVLARDARVPSGQPTPRERLELPLRLVLTGPPALLAPPGLPGLPVRLALACPHREPAAQGAVLGAAQA